MKGCICHFAKWQIHLFISKGTIYLVFTMHMTCHLAQIVIRYYQDYTKDLARINMGVASFGKQRLIAAICVVSDLVDTMQ